jgi:hypothetical protein
MGEAQADFEWSVVSEPNSQGLANDPTTENYVTHKGIERISQRLQTLRLLAEDAHLETKRSYEGDPSRRSFHSAPSLLSELRKGQHRRT